MKNDELLKATLKSTDTNVLLAAFAAGPLHTIQQIVRIRGQLLIIDELMSRPDVPEIVRPTIEHVGAVLRDVFAAIDKHDEKTTALRDALTGKS